MASWDNQLGYHDVPERGKKQRVVKWQKVKEAVGQFMVQ